MLGRSLAMRLGATACRARFFSTGSVLRVATVMDMPAMSPTMEEGGIIKWEKKAGDTFKVGDVLLEVETDKAQISVEAQDDGIMAKVLMEEGAKNIPVGKPIAILAEEDDDITKIDFDALIASSTKAQAPKEEARPEEPKPSASSAPKTEAAKPQAQKTETTETTQKGERKNKGEIMPSVIRLLHANNISKETYSTIAGTGPTGRVTKGDVLAFLGQIGKDVPAAEEHRLEKLEKLDLSNIEVAAPKAAEAPADKAPKVPEFIVEVENILFEGVLPVNAEQLLAKAKRLALRDVALAARPKPSSLRDPAFDAVTTPSNKLNFEILNANVKILRAKPVGVSVSVKYRTAGAAQAKKFLELLRTYLIEV